MKITIPIRAQEKLWIVEFTPHEGGALGDEDVIYAARARSGTNHHWSRWSISGEFHDDFHPKEADVVAWYVREYRSQVKTLLTEKNPKRVLKTTDKSRFHLFTTGDPEDLIRREVEDLAFALAQMHEEHMRSIGLKRAQHWTAQEPFLRDHPAYASLSTFYARYDAIVDTMQYNRTSVENGLNATVHALFDMDNAPRTKDSEITNATSPKQDTNEGKKTFTVFYSWQSDRPNATNRGFINEALKRAVKALSKDIDLKVEARVDKDTQGVPGSPDIVNTILEKIAAADAFVADLTLIDNHAPRRTPNPNVLFELGYAFRALGPDRILMVFNDAFGHPRDLPFDLGLKRTTMYTSHEKDEDRSGPRQTLAKNLEHALRAMLLTNITGTK